MKIYIVERMTSRGKAGNLATYDNLQAAEEHKRFFNKVQPADYATIRTVEVYKSFVNPVL